MVRRIQSCSFCRQRFISFANVSYCCDTCKRNVNKDKSKQQTTTSITNLNLNEKFVAVQSPSHRPSQQQQQQQQHHFHDDTNSSSSRQSSEQPIKTITMQTDYNLNDKNYTHSVIKTTINPVDQENEPLSKRMKHGTGGDSATNSYPSSSALSSPSKIIVVDLVDDDDDDDDDDDTNNDDDKKDKHETKCQNQNKALVNFATTTTTTTSNDNDKKDDDCMEIINDDDVSKNSGHSSSSELCGSEAGDDFYCTQLGEAEEEDVEEVYGDNDDEHVDIDENNNNDEKNYEQKEQELEKEQRQEEKVQEKEQSSEDIDINKNQKNYDNVDYEMKHNHSTANDAIPIESMSNGGDRNDSYCKTQQQQQQQQNNDICFICGTNLSKLKRRIDHIKRCSKKYGITGRDVKLNDDHEIFTASSTTTKHNNSIGSSISKGNENDVEQQENTTNATDGIVRSKEDGTHISNPYSSKGSTSWHGTAELDLEKRQTITTHTNNNQYQSQQSENNNNNKSTTTTSSSSSNSENDSNNKTTINSNTMKQMTMNKFFIRPIRDLNNVLLTSARRIAKHTTQNVVTTVTSKKQVKSNNEENQSNNNKNSSSSEQGNGYGVNGKGNKRGRGGRKSSFQRKREYYSKRNCPTYKQIPGTDFVCDGFLYAKSSLTQNYFLTHFHSDHYGGITSSWNAGIIYCSLPTAKLVNKQLGVDMKYIHPLAMMTPTTIESGKTIRKPITVTLLDANHCPGAVMFLFEITNKTNNKKRTILHVGDFRWNQKVMLQQQPIKSIVTGQMELDDLFLDTTYCDPKYALPTQEETIQATLKVVQEDVQRQQQKQQRNTTTTTSILSPSKNGLSMIMQTKKKGKTLHLFGAYTIGKERIYISVAEHFGWKIYVDPARYRILSALDWPKDRMDLLTTKKEETCLWVVPLGHINMKRMPEYFQKCNNNNKPFVTAQYDRIIGYRPTGWSLGTSPSSRTPERIVTSRTSGNLTIHGVPYSEHSSFPELVDCLKCLRPKKIIPTVSVSKSSEQISLLLDALRHKQDTICFD